MRFNKRVAVIRLSGFLILGLFACLHGRDYGAESKDGEVDRRAINAVLVAQQEAWNRRC